MPDEKPEAEVAFLQGIGPAVRDALKDFHPADAIQGIQDHVLQMVQGVLQAQPDDVIQAEPAEPATDPADQSADDQLTAHADHDAHADAHASEAVAHDHTPTDGDAVG